jgi:hypothetical protein
MELSPQEQAVLQTRENVEKAIREIGEGKKPLTPREKAQRLRDAERIKNKLRKKTAFNKHMLPRSIRAR